MRHCDELGDFTEPRGWLVDGPRRPAHHKALAVLAGPTRAQEGVNRSEASVIADHELLQTFPIHSRSAAVIARSPFRR